MATIAWKKFAENPVLSGEAGTQRAWTADPSVAYEDGVYHMWYTGAGRQPWKIFHASSADGLKWEKTERPLNEIGHRASVVPHEGRYYMYLAHGGHDPDFQLEVSERPEGPFRHVRTVMRPEEEWEGDRFFCPDVIYDEDERLWKMWYSAKTIQAGAGWPEPEAVGYATSEDGETWSKYRGNPILGPDRNVSWMGHAVCTLMVVKREGRYYGFSNVVGEDGHSRIAVTESADGISWDLAADSLTLDLGDAGEFDASHLFAPSAVYGDRGWMLWYNGKCADEGGAVESIGGARGKIEG